MDNLLICIRLLRYLQKKSIQSFEKETLQDFKRQNNIIARILIVDFTISLNHCRKLTSFVATLWARYKLLFSAAKGYVSLRVALCPPELARGGLSRQSAGRRRALRRDRPQQPARH